MPKETFYNLKADKQEKIIGVLKETFKNKSIFEANVKEIVEKLQIARGSFYQYFENLEDAYFMILDLETVDVHRLFMKILRENSFQLFPSLEKYGEDLSQELFLEENYSIYKNRYLYWTPDLEKGWQAYKKSQEDLKKQTDKLEKDFADKEEIQFIKAVVHNLIQRTYLNGWTQKEFLEHFNQYTEWLKKGVDRDGTF